MLLCSLAAFATALPVRRAFTITSRASTRQITSAISPMKRRRLLLDEATPEDWKLVADTLGKFATGTRVVRLNEVLAKRRGSLHLGHGFGVRRGVGAGRRRPRVWALGAHSSTFTGGNTSVG